MVTVIVVSCNSNSSNSSNSNNNMIMIIIIMIMIIIVGGDRAAPSRNRHDADPEMSYATAEYGKRRRMWRNLSTRTLDAFLWRKLLEANLGYEATRRHLGISMNHARWCCAIPMTCAFRSWACRIMCDSSWSNVNAYHSENITSMV